MKLEGAASPPSSQAGVSLALPSPTYQRSVVLVAAPSPAAATEQPAPPLPEFTDHHVH